MRRLALILIPLLLSSVPPQRAAADNLNLVGGLGNTGSANTWTATQAFSGVPGWKATGAPSASATSSLVQLGAGVIGSNANGTYLGVNTAAGFTGFLVGAQVNGGAQVWTLDYQGNEVLGGSIKAANVTDSALTILNAIPKHNASGLLADSSITDNGTTVSTAEALSAGAATVTSIANSGGYTQSGGSADAFSGQMVANASLFIPLVVQSGNTNIGQGIEFRSGINLYTNWYVGDDEALGNGLEITPSTAVGGDAFVTPMVAVRTYGVGIGVNAPAGLFSVGAGSPFSVSSTGDVTAADVTQPASSTGNGTAAPAVATVTGAAGGNTTGTTGQTAGKGGGVTIVSGAGGTAPSGSTNGAGGDITLSPGAAGAGLGTAGAVGSVLLAPTGGSVGIGTNAPSASYALDVQGPGTGGIIHVAAPGVNRGAAFVKCEQVVNYAMFGVDSDSGPIDGYPDSVIIRGLNAYPIVFDLSNTIVGEIDPSSNLHIGRVVSLGTALAATDVALSAGWGSTATAAVRGTDSAGTITITSAGTGQSLSPTIILTFHDGAWVAAPVTVANWNTGSTGLGANVYVADTTTTMVLTYAGTPVASSTYEFSFQTRG